MRNLRFIVDNQIICKDPTCDFSGLIPGSSGCLSAEFIFSKEWGGCLRVAGFFSPLGIEYSPRDLTNSTTGVIPFDALQKRSFKIQVVGVKTVNGEKIRLKTNKVVINQDGGKK